MNSNDVSSVQPADPCVMVIFGATGDLTKRKLIPALYNMAYAHLLPKEFAVIGIARSPLSDDDFRQQAGQYLQEFTTDSVDWQVWEQLAQRFYYLSGNVKEPDTYQQLKEQLAQIDEQCGTTGNYLFYLATEPRFFGEIISQLGQAGLAQEQDGHWRRIVIEKPFGHDLNSARQLNKILSNIFREEQIYRIDHYLGKETVQNILVFRFGNGIVEPVWNRQYIDHVQITVAETVGVEGRGSYYESVGALRDMVQNHLFQLLTLVAMEPPTSFEADALRDEKSKVMKAISPLTPEEVLFCAVRGQYGKGMIDGKQVPAYRNEPGVAPDSKTETFVALKLMIDNWRWADVPFYLRTGKRLPKRITEIIIQFKQVPFSLFRQTPVEHLTPNFLTMCIQPCESIQLQLSAKVPGPKIQMGTVQMSFEYADYFGKTPNTGYETLIYDCMIGDSTLFVRADNVELNWSAVQPILDIWQSLPPHDFPNYAAGTWEPKAAEVLIERDGRQWRLLHS
ncbi:glucose-6-phosphate dehydrogenase [Nostocales cyanobacterium HT-58-2]|nr:glucose-6-phosphate dehydrogenase [Nostocales cyanobacterium HT-58-2]